MARAVIRRAVPADADVVQDLTQRAYAVYVPRMGRRPAPMDEDYRELLPTKDCWLAEVGGEIVGVVVTSLQPDHLFVENVAVLPTAQGHGVGTQLLTAAEDHAVFCGLPEVRLYTNEAMTENLAFYPRRGYTETGHSFRNGFRRVLFSKTVQVRNDG